jgi:hypothetical protein
MVLYIDCHNRKTYVTELMRSNKLGYEESNDHVDQEVDIDHVESLFDSEFFNEYINKKVWTLQCLPKVIALIGKWKHLLTPLSLLKYVYI